ncbi:MAG TPA: FAD-binding oxidoreductase, partial [Burkholderiaceae bacterium]|nr:FAD-binding oxidoreductase [Burkholderiaceae bacterium]
GVTPVSMPGLWKQAPGMLLDPEGPLTIRWQHLLKIAPWLFRFMRAGKRQRVEQHAHALASLVRTSLHDYQQITRETGLESMIQPSPMLAVFGSREQFERDPYGWDLRKRNGVEWDTLEGADVQDFEPSLAERFGFALALKNTGFALDPQQLAHGLYETYMKRGGNFVTTEVRSISIEGVQPRLLTASGTLNANRVVIAAGARSALLSRTLGENVPLQQERGYHITLSGYSGTAPRYPIMSPAHKVIATPMACGLRIAGMVEFGGFLPPNHKRGDILRGQLNELFPRVHGGTPSSWMGHRPTLPDSLPVIAQSMRQPSVYYAFGHQHVGLTCAPMTARLIGELIAGETPSVDIRPFRVNRF